MKTMCFITQFHNLNTGLTKAEISDKKRDNICVKINQRIRIIRIDVNR